MQVRNWIAIGLLAIGVCAIDSCSTTKYGWGDYNNLLYNYYQNPNEAQKLIEGLSRIVIDSEKAKNVPPGMYAELGYLFLQKGDSASAIDYFQKESDKWPESTQLMTRLIQNAKKTNLPSN